MPTLNVLGLVATCTRFLENAFPFRVHLLLSTVKLVKRHSVVDSTEHEHTLRQPRLARSQLAAPRYFASLLSIIHKDTIRLC